MFGVVEPHPDLDGIALSDPMENILHFEHVRQDLRSKNLAFFSTLLFYAIAEANGLQLISLVWIGGLPSCLFWSLFTGDFSRPIFGLFHLTLAPKFDPYLVLRTCTLHYGPILAFFGL